VRGTFVRVTSAGPASDGVSLSVYLVRAVDAATRQIPLDPARSRCLQNFHLSVVLPAREAEGVAGMYQWHSRHSRYVSGAFNICDMAGMYQVQTQDAVSDAKASSQTRFLGPSVLGLASPL
jgi:hypothetical protein